MMTLHYFSSSKFHRAAYFALCCMLVGCSLGEDNLNRAPLAIAADVNLTYDPASSNLVSGQFNNGSVDYDGAIKSQVWELTDVVALTKLDSQQKAIPVIHNSRQLRDACIITQPSQKDLAISVLPQAAIYYFNLTVTDDSNTSNSKLTRLVVLPRGEEISSYNSEWPETAAAVSAGPNLRLNAGDRVTLKATTFNLSGYTDFQWQISDDAGLGFSLAQTQGQSILFTAPKSPDNRSIGLSVTASKGQQQYSANVTLEIAANSGPQLASIPSQVVHAGDLVQLKAVVTGAVSRYQWTQIEGVTVNLFAANSANASFTAPQVNAQTLLRFQVEVEDSNQALAHGIAAVTVLPQAADNQAPQVSAGANQNVIFGAHVTQIGNASDSDGQITNYLWTQLSGPSVSLQNANSATLSFDAPADYAHRAGASMQFQLTVKDNNNASASDQVTITMAANQAPLVNAGPDQSVTALSSVTLNGTVSDIDTAIRSVTWSQLSGIAVTLTQNQQQASFTAPNVSQASVLTFRLLAVDDLDGNSVSDTVVITVNPPGVNNPPSVNAGSDLQVNAGDTVQLQGSAFDNDGSIALIEWKRLAGVNVTLQNANSLQASFLAPAVTQASSVSLQLQVTDNGGASASDIVLVTINPPNVAPTVFAGNDLLVASGAPVTVNAQANDSDGFITKYAWSEIAGPSVTLTGSDKNSVSFTAPLVTSNTDITLNVSVTDDRNASASDQVTITVSPNNIPPQAIIQAVDKSNVGDIIELDGSSSVDSDGSIKSYAWIQTAGAITITLNNSNSAIAAFTAPTVTQPTPLQFQLSVTDNNNASGSVSHTVTLYPLASLSGTINVNSANLLDSDINQTGISIPYVSNDSIASAQHISNPFMLGGYVNQPGAGAAGRSQVSGDIDDYYHVTLNAGQVITLNVGAAQTNINELGLYLLEELAPNKVVDVSLSGGNVQNVTATQSGNYFIRVTAQVGASNYILNSAGNAPLQTNGWTLNDNFVADEIIAQQRPGISAANFSKMKTLAGIIGKAGGSDRNQLFGLQRAVANSASATGTALIAANPALQSKLDTLVKAAQLRRDPNLQNVSLNYLLQPSVDPNDSRYPQQWDLPLMNLPLAWNTTFGNSNVIVAVIDTGILPNHPDFAGQLLPGYDFISNATRANDGDGIDSDPTDTGNGNSSVRSEFHGTHVAGTLAAATNNGEGIAGVAGGVRIMPLRVIGVDGATSYDVEQAIRYAAGLTNDSNTVPNQIADVINLSLGGPGTSTTAPSAYRQARAAGVIIVAAAGNDGSNILTTPAGYDGVVSVSAITIARQRAVYSNYGPTIDIAAPGGSGGDINNDGLPDAILSLGANDLGPTLVYEYNYKVGTSMASPHVAAVAALMKSVFPGLTPAMFDTLLANGDLTQDLGDPGRDDFYGYGMIDAAKAVNAAIVAGGGSTTLNPPILSVSPTSLGFGVSLNSQTLSISNAGAGNLIISATTPSASWLQINPLSVDNNNVGSYTVTVNRSGLADNIYNGTIVIQSNAGSQNVSVSMQVMSMSVDTNAGPQVIELVNNATGRLADKLILNSSNGQYAYTFSSVSLGEYTIRSSSDLDNDGILCELGESCGAYPLLGSTISSTIIVDGINTNLNNLDFPTGFDPSLPPK